MFNKGYLDDANEDDDDEHCIILDYTLECMGHYLAFLMILYSKLMRK
jgi:hypothetical protein